MNPKTSALVLVYGIAMAVMGGVARQWPGTSTETILFAGVGGGALCVLLGVLGLVGWRVRPWAIVTLAVVAFVLLSQVVTLWLRRPGEMVEGRADAVLATVMFALTMSLVAYLPHSPQAAPAAEPVSTPQPSPQRHV
ncbi:MAG: hypothetical protein ACYC23_24250 [Limisphaerales bacterium]